jgi:flagellar basal body-associated protein FliL
MLKNTFLSEGFILEQNKQEQPKNKMIPLIIFAVVMCIVCAVLVFMLFRNDGTNDGNTSRTANGGAERNSTTDNRGNEQTTQRPQGNPAPAGLTAEPAEMFTYQFVSLQNLNNGWRDDALGGWNGDWFGIERCYW